MAGVVSEDLLLQNGLTYAGELPTDRDFLFESQCALQLGHAGEVYTYVVDSTFKVVYIRNDTN